MRIPYGPLAFVILAISIAILYGPVATNTLRLMSRSADWALSFMLILALSVIFTIQNAPALRVLLHEGKPSKIGVYLLPLSLIILLVAPSIGLAQTLSWLSLLVFVTGFLICCIDGFALTIAWPVLVSIPLGLRLGPRLDMGETPFQSYLGMALLVGVLLYRSSRFRSWLARTPVRDSCLRCNSPQGVDHCVFCGRIMRPKPVASARQRISKAIPFLALSTITFALAYFDTRFPRLGLETARRFYAELLVASLLGNWDLILASVATVIIFITAFYARHVDRSFDVAGEVLTSSPQLLATFEGFQRTRDITGKAYGEEAFHNIKSMSADEFAENISELRNIGALEPSYTLNCGSILKVWKVKSP